MMINVILLVGIVVVLLLIPWVMGVRYIPHHKVGIVEKFWSQKASALTAIRDCLRST